MALESATYIHDLTPSSPLSTDGIGQGDDHIRMLKQVLKNTFPNLVGACLDLPLPHGIIVDWWGAASAVPTGWAICDGTNGTPNLQGVFTRHPVSGETVGALGGNNGGTFTSTAAGAHDHGGSAGAVGLTVDQLPPHIHTGNTSSQGNHRHGTSGNGGEGGGIAPEYKPGNTNNTVLVDGGTDRFWTSTAGEHYHPFATESTGSGNPHLHPITGVGPHTHDTTIATVPVYMALFKIMKL